MAPIIASEGPAPLTNPSLLFKIDALREKNIGQHIPLPQLVVVGDQSSGKSSLLENLTGIPFPRGQERCTRYATQITSRREEVLRIGIRIIPSPRASEMAKQTMKAFRKQISTMEELRDEFPRIIDEVNVCMNIRTSFQRNSNVGVNINTSFQENFNNASKKVFSEDVLKIEICGPAADYLTVIDVPGIFRTDDEFTTKDDQNLVLNMVRNYIKDDRTIILAVLPSNVDIQTQGILDLAKEYDKAGERTLGVLTKVDLLANEQSSKVPVGNLILGKKKPLLLGYYLVRNRGGDEDEKVNVNEKEAELFAQNPWKNLPSERLGIKSLRNRLTELLNEIAAKAFPKMRTQIRQMMMDAQRELEALGVSRQTEREQQLYLTMMAGEFQSLVRAALDADYSRDAAFESKDSLRLVTFIVNLSERFSKEFGERAHARHFEGNEEVEFEDPDNMPFEVPEQDGATSSTPSVADVVAVSATDLDLHDFPDLREVISTDCELRDPEQGMMKWIETLYYKYRGVELGTIGSGVLSSAFREQSKHWSAMTQQYVNQVVLFIHRFVTEALAVVCPDARVRDRILSSITDDLFTRYKNGLEHAIFLVSVERDQRPYTLNHYFNDNLQICRNVRRSNALKSKARQERKGKNEWSADNLVIDLDDIRGAVEQKSNAEHMQEDIHDILKSYYKVARKRFVDNVYMQAVDHFLLSGPESPLAVFCENWVVAMDEEKLESIAGESRSTREKRESLKKKIVDMKEAVKIMG